MKDFLKNNIQTILFITKVFFFVAMPASLFFFYVWQNVSYSMLSREIRKMTIKKEEFVKKNDDLKIGIAEYTSAERIEGLYRKTYNYLPISAGNKIVTVTLPPERESKIKEKDGNKN